MAEQAKNQHQAAGSRVSEEPQRTIVEINLNAEERERYYGERDKTYKVQSRTFRVALVTLIVLAAYTVFTGMVLRESRVCRGCQDFGGDCPRRFRGWSAPVGKDQRSDASTVDFGVVCNKALRLVCAIPMVAYGAEPVFHSSQTREHVRTPLNSWGLTG